MEDFYMAKNGQTFQRYSLEFKEKVVKEHLEGQSKNSLSKTYNIPMGTVSNWVHKVYVQGTIVPEKRGHPAQVPVDYKERYEILKNYQAFLKEVDRRKSSLHHERATSSSAECPL
jgi:transposase-like protein